MNITTYKTKKNEIRYKLKTYIGTDIMTGKQVNCHITGKTKQEVKLKYNRKLAEFERNGFTKDKNLKPSVTFEEVAKDWFEIHKKKLRPSSIISTELHLKNNLFPALAKIKMKEITPKIIQKLLVEMSDKYAKSTYKSIRGILKQIMKFAYVTGIIESNPLDKVYIPQSNKRKVTRDFMTRDELFLFLDKLKDEKREYKRDMYCTLFRLLAYSGCRIGEICALSWSDIDFENNSISISKTIARNDKENKGTWKISDVPKNISSIGNVPLDNETMKCLKKWKIAQGKHFLSLGLPRTKLVFTSELGNLLLTDKVRQYLKKHLNKCGITKNITPHSFRHTHATLLLESGANIKDVQTRLRHADITTTMNIYTHQTDESSRKSAERFSNFMQI